MKKIVFMLPLLASCMYMDMVPKKPAYVANVAYVNSFREKNEYESHLYYGIDHVQGHFAFSLTDHLAIYSAPYLNKYNPWFWENGVSLYYSPSKNFQFSYTIGYAYGESHFERKFNRPNDEHTGQYYKITTIENYCNRISFQPSVTFFDKRFSFSLSTRYSYLYFPYYFYDQYEYTEVSNYISITPLAHFEKRNKKSYTFDPAITIKRSWGKFNLMFQALYPVPLSKEDSGILPESAMMTPLKPVFSWGFGVFL